MKKLIFFLFTLLFSTVIYSQNYYIKVSAKTISNNKVELKVKTNIPLPVTVDAGLDLKGQKDDDIYVGYSEHVKLTKPLQTIVIDFKDANLPSSKYLAVVTFHHLWGADGGNPEAKKITKSIEGTYELSLKGGGESVKQNKKKSKEKQLSIIKNVAKLQCNMAFRGFIRAINPNYIMLRGHSDRWKFKLSKNEQSLIGISKKYVQVEALIEDEIRDATCTYYINPGEVVSIGISKPIAQTE